ncbi:MAG: tetratricopeptide repeat protein [Acidobacteriota bacterium]
MEEQTPPMAADQTEPFDELELEEIEVEPINETIEAETTQQEATWAVYVEVSDEIVEPTVFPTPPWEIISTPEIPPTPIAEKPIQPVLSTTNNPNPPFSSLDAESDEVKKLLAEIDRIESTEINKPGKIASKPIKKLPTLPSLNDAAPVQTQNGLGPLEQVLETSTKTSPDAPTATENEPAVNELLAELSRIESQEISSKKGSTGALRMKPVTGKLSTPSAKTAELPSVNETLAEMSFFEGQDALERGDRVSAIGHFRNALNYHPDKVEYLIKLAYLLEEEIGTITEAEQLFCKAIEISPGNLEIRAHLAELRNRLDPNSSGNAEIQAAKSANASRGNAFYSDYDTRELPIASKRNVTGVLSNTGPLKAVEAAPSAGTGRLKTIGQKEKKPNRFLRGRFSTGENFSLPSKFSFTSQVILGIIIAVVIWSAIFILRSGPDKITVTLITPNDEANVITDTLELSWRAPATHFRVLVEENGKKVMERITQETRYTINEVERELFKPDRRYSWRIIPITLTGEELPHVTEEFHFKVLSSAKNRSITLPNNNQPADKPLQQGAQR